MTDKPSERFVVFDPKPEPRFFMKADAEVRDVTPEFDYDSEGSKPRVVYHMDVMNAAGQRMVLQVGPAALRKMREEAERLARMNAAPWYRRWPSIAARRVGYWTGRLVGAVLNKVRRK